jgi:hypothetical protein
MVFMPLTLSQLGHAMAVRSNRESLFTMGIMENRYCDPGERFLSGETCSSRRTTRPGPEFAHRVTTPARDCHSNSFCRAASEIASTAGCLSLRSTEIA